jgi:hypothetical protein
MGQQTPARGVGRRWWSGMTGIEWTQHVWNPTTGCDKVSRGCEHCYALSMAKRLKGMGSAKYQRDGDPRTSGPGFAITEHPDAVTQPLTWRQPRRVFVNSMSDLFHQGVTDKFLAQVWAVMAATPQHTYQVLTKRHGRMRSLLRSPTFWHLAHGIPRRLVRDPIRALGNAVVPAVAEHIAHLITGHNPAHDPSPKGTTR